MSALTTLIRKDAVLAWRNGLVLVTVITLAIIIALYWTLPLMVSEETDLGATELYHDGTEDGSLTAFFAAAGSDVSLLDSRAALEDQVAASDTAVGVSVTGTAVDPAFELIYRHVPGDRFVAVTEAAMRNLAAALAEHSYGAPVETEQLRPMSDSLAANESMLNVMLAFEVMILGFLFVAVVVFGEKQEGSLRAYRVTPAGIGPYIAAKALVFTVLGTGYGLVMVLATRGFDADYAALSLTLLLSCGLMTVLGLGIAVFFRNISEWFVPGVVALSINMLSVIPYQIPTYRAEWLTRLPGYIVIFGVTEMLYPTGRTDYAVPMYLTLGAWLVGATLFAIWAVSRNIMKEA